MNKDNEFEPASVLPPKDAQRIVISRMLFWKRHLSRLPTLLAPLVTSQCVSILNTHCISVVTKLSGLHLCSLLSLECSFEFVTNPSSIESMRKLALNNWTPIFEYVHFLKLVKLSSPCFARSRRTSMSMTIVKWRVVILISVVVVGPSRLHNSIPPTIDGTSQTPSLLNQLIAVAIMLCDVMIIKGWNLVAHFVAAFAIMWGRDCALFLRVYICSAKYSTVVL